MKLIRSIKRRIAKLEVNRGYQESGRPVLSLSGTEQMDVAGSRIIAVKFVSGSQATKTFKRD